MNLPKNHKSYTDKYFSRTKEILEAEGLNPKVSVKVFTRGIGNVVGLDDTVEVLTKFSNIEKTGEIWVTKKHTYNTKDSLIIYKAPAQDVVDLETLSLGVLSDALSKDKGLKESSPQEITDKFRRLKEIYQDVPILYFGARHYHWSKDAEIAKAALAGGAVQTSTDVGSANIGKEGVGTTPHFLTLVLAAIYGKELATLKTAQLFDKHIDPSVPRTTLTDTFNKELTDSLAVAKYFGQRKNSFRIDTCGENIGEGGSLYNGQKTKDPSYQMGTGVTVELAKNLRMNLINNGFGDFTETVLSSSFGNEEKAKIFMQANQEFKEKTGYNLFAAVGIGEVYKAQFCTADIFEVDGKPMSKIGREVNEIDYTQMRRVI
jgi:nicotinate phosphoribosyltransferase